VPQSASVKPQNESWGATSNNGDYDLHGMTERLRQFNDRHGTATLPLLIGMALLFTLLNAFKALHIDDTFILRVAQQIATNPLDPYGFEIFWVQWPQPVIEELTPPLLPYWWAVGLQLFGESPFLWKLWLVPFSLLLTGSLYSLFRRFAPGVAMPLVALTLFSPVLLPGFNLMQDLPATALGLTALSCYLHAADRSSLKWAALAGCVGGLACQTKYTAVAMLAVISIHALLNQRKRIGFVTVLISSTIFAAWEIWMTLSYGRGMFAGQLQYGDQFWYPRLAMIVPLIQLIGAMAPVIGLLAAVALGVSRRLVVGLAVVVVVAHASLLFWPVERLLFQSLGIAVCGLLIGLVWHAFRRSPLLHGPDLFLLSWLVVEVCFYFGTAPFPAVRRVIGIVMVMTLLVARNLALVHGRKGSRVTLAVLTSVGLLLGGGYYWVDVKEAAAQRDAVVSAERYIRQIDPDPSIWYLGHWGFQYYAEAAGMQPVIPERSELRQSDWLVVPGRVHRQNIVIDAGQLDLRASLDSRDRLPVSTLDGYYDGSIPVRHRDGPLLSTAIYRVTEDLVPLTNWSPERLAGHALAAGGQTAAAAVPALIRVLSYPRTQARRLAARALAEQGVLAEPAVSALTLALEDQDLEVRVWSAKALGRIGPPASSALPMLEAMDTSLDNGLRQIVRQAIERIR
jgi:hypothetical protein